MSEPRGISKTFSGVGTNFCKGTYERTRKFRFVCIPKLTNPHIHFTSNTYLSFESERWKMTGQPVYASGMSPLSWFSQLFNVVIQPRESITVTTVYTLLLPYDAHILVRSRSFEQFADILVYHLTVSHTMHVVPIIFQRSTFLNKFPVHWFFVVAYTRFCRL